MLHPRVPLPGDWATGGCPLVAPAPRGSPGDIPRDPVCPSRQMAASFVSTINPAAGRQKAKGRQQGKANCCPSPSTGGNTGFGGATARSPSPACRLSRHLSTELKQQKESQIPTTAEERGVCSCQRWSRRAPALPGPGAGAGSSPSTLTAARCSSRRLCPFPHSPLILKTHALVLVLQLFIKCLLQPSSHPARAFSSCALGLSSQEPADPEHNCKTQACQQGADSGPPKPEVFQKVLASFLPCSPIRKKLPKNLKVSAAAGQIFIFAECLLQAQGTHCPQSRYLLPLTAACFFYPSRSNALLPKTTLGNIQDFTQTPKCSEYDC